MATSLGPAPTDVPRFIRSCIERAGGAVDANRSGRLDVLLPASLESAAGGRSWLSLALEAEVLDPGDEIAMVGSPFLDALIAHAVARGSVAAGYLPAGRIKRKGFREEVERTLLFSNCRTRYPDDEAELRAAATVQFDFKVTFLSEERRERLYVVPVNLFSNQVDLPMAGRLAELPISSEPLRNLSEAPSVSIPAAYETASRALRVLVAQEAQRQQIRVAQRFGVEFARIDDFYAQIITDLERRMARERDRAGLPAASANARPNANARRSAAGGVTPIPSGTEVADAPEVGGRADSIARKLEAVDRERERKLRELGQNYAIRMRARLASVRCLWQPKQFFKISLDRGAVTRSLVLAFDPLLERFEPPTCEGCEQATTRLHASESRLLCPTCAGR